MKYKVGDKVRVKSLEWYNENKSKEGNINYSDRVFFAADMSKFCGSIVTIKKIDVDIDAYEVEENSYYWTDKMLEGLAEDTIQPIVFENIITDKVELCLGNDYEIVVEDGRTFVQRKKPKYPTTYEDCCRVLNVWYKDDVAYVAGYQNKLLSNFQKLLICRDAYWKIAGDWKPDWADNYQKKWIINFYQDEINLTNGTNVHFVLVFPTKEMRDAFYENFKDLIENCKELL